jgi:adenine deaminase
MNTDVPAQVRARAVAAAAGRAPFDRLLVNGTVLDVGTCELRAADVGIVGPMISSVHPSGTRADAGATTDVAGSVIVPGFIDMHVHFESSMLTPAAYAAAVCPRGTTTVHCDPHELANVAGLAGVRYAVEASRGLPVEFLVQAPSCVPPVPGAELSAADFGAAEIAEMLSWAEIRGLAEVMDTAGVLNGSQRMLDVVAAGLASGKLLNGHAAGLSGPDLQAYLSAGMSSDHEMMATGDVIERLRAGMTVELRGAYEFVLPDAVQALNSLPQLPAHIVAATDDLFAMTLLRDGGIDHLLRRLIGYGLDPAVAVRIATYNAALRLGRPDLGMVAPGRLANLLVISDLALIRADKVFSRGQLVAADGEMIAAAEPTRARPPSAPMRVGRLTPGDFTFRLPNAPDPVRLRVLKGAVFTEWETRSARTRNGVLELPDDCIFQAVLHRHGRRAATPAVGVLSGWGTLRGAIATSVSHDTHNLVVFGREPEDMAVAANAVISAGGGVAVAASGELICMIELPITGLLSPHSAGEVGAAQERLQRAALDIGLQATVLSQPLFQVMTATLPCIPGPHVTDLGVVDGSTGEIFGSLPVAAV